MTGAEVGGTRPQPGAPEAQVWKGQTGPSFKVLGVARSCRHLDLGFRLQDWERVTFCCFEPPSLWSFILAAPGPPGVVRSPPPTCCSMGKSAQDPSGYDPLLSLTSETPGFPSNRQA